ncbi:oxidoreductase [Paenibacillus sp. J31TS4]|uniref:SDR family NAD(P)-dependent oxidoreductase n=1 Tax=Paenibacillus sp. J31TS4 TaxID=2807195 RepID=UPI001AFE10A9|nr:SDR family oxidoreductase [Paenibacillus sp. J31TS4]GIP41271.1 oxidoreductase [Paenibacillus sp. J31TS4]
MRLAGKVVIVTGASSGIGALLAEELAKREAVPILFARSEEKLRRIAERASAPMDWYAVDVTSDEQVEDAVRAVLQKHGRIDILVNNAGFGLFERVAATPMDAFREMMDVNYFGTVRCTKAVLPAMLEAGSGQIVNVASMAGKVGSAKSAGYAATKHAVLGFTNSLRPELAGTGIRVSAVNPGPVDTPFFDRADPTGHYVKNVGWFLLQPERVVRTIIRVIEKSKAEADLPFAAAFATKLYQLFPRLLDRIANRLLSRK